MSKRKVDPETEDAARTAREAERRASASDVFWSDEMNAIREYLFALEERIAALETRA